jgi:hypothetical protein
MAAAKPQLQVLAEKEQPVNWYVSRCESYKQCMISGRPYGIQLQAMEIKAYDESQTVALQLRYGGKFGTPDNSEVGDGSVTLT